MSVKFANNAFGTLNAGISNSATSLTLSSGQGARFPTLASGEYFYATLIDTSNNLEVVKCTARSTDVLTITRAQESTTAQAFAIGDRVELRVTAQGLDDAANPYDKDTSSTGSLALPVGTTAQQPTAADTEGHIRYDSDDSVVYFSNGTNWLKISSVIATLSSVTGNIFTGSASTLTLSGQGFQTANLIVNFTQSSDSIDVDVSVTPTSDTAATVTVPSTVYSNVTSGNVVSVSVTNSDGVASGVVSKTALALPSGGTITTSGNYRYHTFTSSGTFTNTVSNLSVDYLLVAGGGGGGGSWAVSTVGNGGGGGAGGAIDSTATCSAQGYAVTVGGGGLGTTATSQNSTQGSSSSVFGATAVGGGRGGTYQNTSKGGNGGSGGGGGYGPDTASSGTAGQGNAGGVHAGTAASPYYGCGGGGGKGAAGAAGTGTVGGNGGVGIDWKSLGTYYAGGGGGAGSYNVSSSAGSGGNGGGGNATATSTRGGAGTANTGGGGGGGGAYQSLAYGGNGGSGTVIIRYQL